MADTMIFVLFIASVILIPVQMACIYDEKEVKSEEKIKSE